ncbi:biotin/lipoyl-binding protein [Actinospica durhamensis]|uniref:Biotin/lipoyl-binding protein n=1 Tax=Actinospica durhamensis TaxID=1508375 RepID=A0A941ENJ6_9ACTN|nr:biotin/lipoyl-binding protein [Actinospica durhamensis]MBR7832314.1 biotin/lipoyl-binding protein [Actinospica durhamensis]
MKYFRSSRRAALNSGLAVVLVGAGVAAYLEVGSDTTASASSFTRMATVSRGTVLAQVSASGNLALAAQSSLAFGASGKVTAVDVTVGQTVKAGQVLATVDPTAANLALTEAKEQLTVAQDNLAKAQDGPSAQQQAVNNDQLTSDENAVNTAQQNLDSAESDSKSTTAQIQQDKNSLSNAEDQLQSARDQQALSNYVDPGTLAQDQESVTQAQASVNTAQTEVDGTTITAPSAGTILTVAGQVGSQVSAGSSTTGAASTSSGSGSSSTGSSSTGSSSSSSSSSSSAFITMADVSQLQITADVSETDIDSIKVGQDATITLNANSSSPLGATVATISPTSTVVSNVVEYAVTLNLTGDAPAGVRPGQSASILITTGEASNALYVPSSAITTTGSNSYVTVVTAGKDTLTKVTTGVVGTTDTEIKTGLTQGQQVMLTISSTSGSSTTGRGFGGIGTGTGGFGGTGAFAGGQG